MKNKIRARIAEYMGLRVEVICRMDHCSLISFKGRECIVETADLTFVFAAEQAA